MQLTFKIRPATHQRRDGFTFVEIMIVVVILSTALAALSSSIFSLQSGKEVISENQRAAQIAQAVIERIQGETWDTLGKSPATWYRSLTDDASLDYADQLTASTTNEFQHRPLTDEPSGPNVYSWINLGLDDDLDGVYDASGFDMEDFSRDQWGLLYLSASQKAWYNNTDPAAAAPSGGTVPSNIVAKYDTPERYNWLQFVGILDKPSGLNNLRVYVEYYRMQAMDGISNVSEWETARAAAGNQLDESHVLLDLTELDDLDSESVVVRIVVRWDRRNGRADAEHEVIFARRQ